MSIQLARANFALGKPTATPWFETITPHQITQLLTWTGDTTKKKEQRRDYSLWINVIEAACQRGELASTAVTETKKDVFASIWAAYDAYDAGPQYREVTSYHIKPQDAARWLEGQGQPPGELLEAWFKSQGVGVAAVVQPAPSAQPEAVFMPSPAVPAAAESWHIKQPERTHGYNLELYRVLKAAHDAGKPRPNARDVLDSWAASKPPNILEVMTDEFKCLDSSGKLKLTSIEALKKAIVRMTTAR